MSVTFVGSADKINNIKMRIVLMRDNIGFTLKFLYLLIMSDFLTPFKVILQFLSA